MSTLALRIYVGVLRVDSLSASFTCDAVEVLSSEDTRWKVSSSWYGPVPLGIQHTLHTGSPQRRRCLQPS